MASEDPRTAAWPELSAAIVAAITDVAHEADTPQRRADIEDLRRRLEAAYCAKVGVRDDDVAYCAYAQSGRCGYINGLQRVWEEHGVNLITGTVR